jgi:membrane protease YdiL (CAAX protease family)
MEYRSGFSRQLPPFIRIIVFFVLILLSWVMSLSSLQASLPLFFGVSDPAGFMAHITEQTNAPAILFILAINSIGIFLLPPLLFFLIFHINTFSFLRLDRFPPAKFWLAGIVIMLASGVFIQLLVQIETYVPLPAKWAYLRQENKLLENMIDVLFNAPSILHLLLLTLIVAFLPALSEEIYFRGVIQNYLAKTNLGNIGAIIITGLCFSLMHGEFDNFLAIWCMGIVLGLLYYYSGSLWVNVTAHFINNFTIVGAKYAYHMHLLHTDMSDTDMLPLYVTLPAGLVMVGGLFLLKKWNGMPPNQPPNPRPPNPQRGL